MKLGHGELDGERQGRENTRVFAKPRQQRKCVIDSKKKQRKCKRLLRGTNRCLSDPGKVAIGGRDLLIEL